MEITVQAKLQPQLAEVMLSTKSSPNDRRIGSSRLNLISEGLLLGANLQRHASDSNGKPRKLDLQLGTPSGIQKLRLPQFYR
jgi:hypothetical protein